MCLLVGASLFFFFFVCVFALGVVTVVLVAGCAARPGGLFNQEAKAKFDEWTKRQGVAKEDAMKEYVKKVDELCGTGFESKI